MTRGMRAPTVVVAVDDDDVRSFGLFALWGAGLWPNRRAPAPAEDDHDHDRIGEPHPVSSR